MKYGIVVFPGSNCDQDSFYAIKSVMNDDVDYIWHESTSLNNFDCVILPGGFSYGDYLRAGAIARFSPIMQKVIDFANGGGLVLGICNGFQILLESHLLPGAMVQNQSVHFICKSVYLITENTQTPFTKKLREGEIIRIPIAHQEGNYYCDDKTYLSLEENKQILFRYCDVDGYVNEKSNPNGSKGNIAGISNAKKNVFGLMPHPERAMELILGSDDGKKIFYSIQNFINQQNLLRK